MPTLKLSLDPQTYDALCAAASSHLRPPDWHAETLLRQALGLPFPLPAEPQRAKKPKEAPR
jgi:hypothetical protein